MRRPISACAVVLGLLLSHYAAERIAVRVSAVMTVGTAKILRYPSNTTTATSTSTDTTSCTAPCAYIIATCAENTTVTAPTDNDSGTYTGLTDSPGANSRVRTWYRLAVTTRSDYTFTCNSGLAAYQTCIFIPISGMKSSSAVGAEATAVNGADGTTNTLAGFTPGENDMLLVTATSHGFTAGRTVSYSAGFTEAAEATYFDSGFNVGCSLATEVQTTATARTLTATFSGTENRYDTNLTSFKMEPAATSVGAPLLLLVGE